VAELIAIFLEDTPPRVAQLRDAPADLPTLRRVAHTLKGACGNMTALPASEAASRLEAAAGRGDAGEAEAARLALLDEMDRLFGELGASTADAPHGTPR
jgi:HPt (histidine-containing phosphotransfer) domain-containing protein